MPKEGRADACSMSGTPLGCAGPVARMKQQRSGPARGVATREIVYQLAYYDRMLRISGDIHRGTLRRGQISKKGHLALPAYAGPAGNMMIRKREFKKAFYSMLPALLSSCDVPRL
jgi:hypothetical protein